MEGAGRTHGGVVRVDYVLVVARQGDRVGWLRDFAPRVVDVFVERDIRGLDARFGSETLLLFGEIAPRLLEGIDFDVTLNPLSLLFLEAVPGVGLSHLRELRSHPIRIRFLDTH